MIEKERFTTTICDECRHILKDRDSNLSVTLRGVGREEELALLDTLNGLHKDNIQLKQEIQGCKDDRLRFEEEARIDATNNVIDEENEMLKKENEELKRKHYNELMEEGVKIERLREENEKLNKENNELKIQLTVEEMDKEALTEQTAIDIEHYTKQNEKLQDQISMLKTTIARNEAYIHQLTKHGEWRK